MDFGWWIGPSFSLSAGSKTNDNGFVFCSRDKNESNQNGWNILKTDFSGNIIFRTIDPSNRESNQ